MTITVINQEYPPVITGGSTKGTIYERPGMTGSLAIDQAGRVTRRSPTRTLSAKNTVTVQPHCLTGILPLQIGSLQASIAPDSTGSGKGTIAWTYQVVDKQLDFLAAGQRLSEAYDITISDGLGGRSTQTVTITLVGSNDAPSARNDVGITAKSSVLNVWATNGVLANDADPDLLDIRTVTAIDGVAAVGRVFTLPSGALVQINANGSYTYNPNGKFSRLASGQSAVDAFTYTMRDSAGAVSTATVTITIAGSKKNISTANDVRPITLQSVGGIKSIVLEVDYNPARLNLVGLLAGVDLPAGSQIQVTTAAGASGSVKALITITTPTALRAGSINLGDLLVSEKAPNDPPVQVTVKSINGSATSAQSATVTTQNPSPPLIDFGARLSPCTFSGASTSASSNWKLDFVTGLGQLAFEEAGR